MEDGIPGRELKDRLGLDDIVSVLGCSRLQWRRHVMCGVEGARLRGGPGERDCADRHRD